MLYIDDARAASLRQPFHNAVQRFWEPRKGESFFAIATGMTRAGLQFSIRWYQYPHPSVIEVAPSDDPEGAILEAIEGWWAKIQKV